MRRLTWLLPLVVVAITACGAPGGGGGASSPASADTTAPAASDQQPSTPPHVTPMPDAEASGVETELVAEAGRWDLESLTVPAEQTWTLVLDNRDDVHAHNFTIVDGPGVAGRIYQSPNSTGPVTETYEIPGLPAGTYEYVCTLPEAPMTGTLTVE